MGVQTATVPAQAIGELRQQMARKYGARLVDEGDRQVLLIRVPRGEPDPVNDVEAAVDYLDPGDVEQATHCILVGDERISQVYASPLKDLMKERLRFDAQEINQQRAQLPGTLCHNLYRSPADPRRRWRLAVRLPMESVRDLDETTLEELADQIGAKSNQAAFDQLATVYLIAAQDEVCMDPELFVQELRKAWADEDRRRRLLAEHEAKLEAQARRAQAERRALLKDLEGKFRAPTQPATRRRLDTRGRDDSPRMAAVASAEADVEAVRPRMAQGSVLPEVDRAVATQQREVDTLTHRVDALTRRAQDLRPGDDVADAVARKLTLDGYDVLIEPDTPYPIDIAAERPGGPMQRIVFRLAPRLTSSEATELLRMAKELDVDQVFCVAEQADEEAKRRLVATKVTWFRPHELGTLRL